MKYMDKNLTVIAPKINGFDTDRPCPALTRLFNPQSNILKLQSASLINRITAITHEITERITVGILDQRLHCILPIIAYFRDKNIRDSHHILSNKLNIKSGEFARDLITNVKPIFYKTQVDILDAVFSKQEFLVLIINIDDVEPLMTAIDRMKSRRGIISIHNPEHKDNTKIIKYCLDNKLYLIEHSDNSADLIRI